MLDIQTGTLRLPNGVTLNADTQPDPAALTGFQDKGDMNGFHVFFGHNFDLWGRKFGLTLRFQNDRLQFIEMIGSESKLQSLGWDSTEKDLLDEKKKLVAMLTKHLGMGPTDTSLGVDYFPFPWGLVSVVADPRSVMASVAINYSYKS